jgi:exopolysaccharide biosynthesis protein
LAGALALVGALCLGTPARADIISLPIDFSSGLPARQDSFVSDWEYRDESIHVVIEQGRQLNTDYWAARITIATPAQLRSVSAGGFDSNMVMPGESLARRVNAILAVDGDYYCYIDSGYLVRQGELYRNLPAGDRDVLLIDERGDFHIVPAATPESLATYEGRGIVNSFNFGPALVIDGERVKRYVDQDNAANKGRQRMCVAQVGPLEYMAIACAGPARGSQGMTLDQFSKLVHSYGVKNAYNLDGGDSTMMIFDGQKINDVKSQSVRSISDILYFASALDS